MHPDKRALEILFDTYWSSTGWKSPDLPNRGHSTPPADLEYAVRSGVMFPPRRFVHETVQDRIRELRSQIEPRELGRAFVATLSSKFPALRSSLGSYAVALHMPFHELSDTSGSRRCSICGQYDFDSSQDVNVFNFERHKWGGVRHTNPEFIVFDLERFIEEHGDTPTRIDWSLFEEILSTVESMEPGSKLSHLVKALRPVIPGNVDQRRAVIGILGFSGVIRVEGRSGFFHSYTPCTGREETPWYKDDWPYPIQWWKGGAGIDAEALEFWFGL